MKEKRDVRKLKKERKRQWLKTQSAGSSTPTGRKKADHDDGEDEGENDWEELAREEKIAKKVRRGQATQKEFDDAFWGLV